ncbi:MAG: DUF4157 domain-containing protein, partial [Deltaproteobacteria bacterium]|nr:DUF4157 domain-containing protein [Deltaproteobacteria bacterium]
MKQPAVRHAERQAGGPSLTAAGLQRVAVRPVTAYQTTVPILRADRDLSRVPVRVQDRGAITEPGDHHEREADRAAAMRRPAPSGRRTLPAPSSGVLPPVVRDALRSPGQALDVPTRAIMEMHFGHDFSRVRVHTGASAEESARDLNALAYTAGHEIVFGGGQFRPETVGGRRLLAHELGHVVQQQHGPVIARAVAAHYSTINDNLSYGLFDWAITDAEAHGVLVILAALAPPDLRDTVRQMESDGLVDRLIENISDADRTAYASLIQQIHQQRSTGGITRHIESLMSYGLLDWVITDAEAHAALEALKSLQPVPARLRDVVVAIPATQYERFFDNLSHRDRRENLRFLQDIEIMRSTGRTFAELAVVQRMHLEARALAAGVSVGTYIRGETTAHGYGGNPALWWPSLSPPEKAAWIARFDA